MKTYLPYNLNKSRNMSKIEYARLTITRRDFRRAGADDSSNVEKRGVADLSSVSEVTFTVLGYVHETQGNQKVHVKSSPKG